MVNKEARAKYRPTIGIECHVQLKTKTKLFAAVDNDARAADPNTLISHICVGLPGALPVLNKEAIELSARAAVAFNTEPQRFSKFDRKHYFYPDLPKGYQITQYEDPIITGGFVEIELDDQKKKIKLTRVHLEEDAGKNTHPVGADYSLVDLNRAGTPLLEIVSEPEIHSATEAKAYARELWLLMRYADVSDADLYLGHMRFDVNISVSKTEKPGKRTEIKNLNSFRSVENAVLYEIDRQIDLLEKGEKIVQETRGWDEAKQKTTSQRGKEEAHDYRYMPEPDIPPIELSEDFIAKIKKTEAVLPQAVRQKLMLLNIDKKVVEDVLDQEISRVHQVLDIASKHGAVHGRRIIFWLLETGALDLERDVELSKMIETGEVSLSAAKKIREEMASSSDSAAETAKNLNLVQVSDEAQIEKIVAEVLAHNEQAVSDAKGGEAKVIGFLVGQVMAKSQGKANPELAQKIIKKQLGI